MLKWTYAGSKHVPGLLNRRKIEQRLCLKGAA
jgi:GH24 family phage-related lysozyme (muramidase)